MFGRAPLYFYLNHIGLYAGIGHLLTPHGTSIALTVPLWLLGLLILFLPCMWYGQFKQRQPAASVFRYL